MQQDSWKGSALRWYRQTHLKNRTYMCLHHAWLLHRVQCFRLSSLCFPLGLRHRMDTCERAHWAELPLGHQRQGNVTIHGLCDHTLWLITFINFIVHKILANNSIHFKEFWWLNEITYVKYPDVCLARGKCSAAVGRGTREGWRSLVC